jgi:uncharacterized protein
MLFVIDTNVLVSAALGNGPCRNAFEIGQRIGQIIHSEETFIELTKTLDKPRLQKFLNPQDKIDFIANFLLLSKPCIVTEKITKCRDPKDNMFLELAVSAKADAIITRDGDLLSLHPFRDIQIITITNFLKTFAQ